MTVHSHLGVQATLELLENLRGGIREFAAREQKLKSELRDKLAALRYRRDGQAEESRSRISAEIGQAEATFQVTKAAVQTSYDRRKSRITEAHKSSKKSALGEIEGKEGRRKHKLQTETLQAKRQRETELASTETTCEEFKIALASEDEALAALEARARSSFQG